MGDKPGADAKGLPVPRNPLMWSFEYRSTQDIS